MRQDNRALARVTKYYSGFVLSPGALGIIRGYGKGRGWRAEV